MTTIDFKDHDETIASYILWEDIQNNYNIKNTPTPTYTMTARIDIKTKSIDTSDTNIIWSMPAEN